MYPCWVVENTNSCLIKIFKQLQLHDGKVCTSCFDNLNSFSCFKKFILLNRQVLIGMKHEREKSKALRLTRNGTDTESVIRIPDHEKLEMSISRVESTSAKMEPNEKLTKSLKGNCPVCGKTITTRALSTHLKTHDTHRERPFLCEICSKTYHNRHELLEHRR